MVIYHATSTGLKKNHVKQIQGYVMRNSPKVSFIIFVQTKFCGPNIVMKLGSENNIKQKKSKDYMGVS